MRNLPRGPLLAATSILVVGVLVLADRDRPQSEITESASAPPSSNHSRVAGDGLAPKAPNPWFFVERAYPQGRIEREDWQRAQVQARAFRDAARRQGGGSWVARGPTNVGGRITSVAVDPTDDSVVFVGAAEGGVLRTTDAGQSWTPLFDDAPTLAIGAVALDPSNPDVVYAGTGEVNPGGGSVAYGGLGIFRSPDGGDSWVALGLETTGAIGRIRIDPQNPDRIFVAAMGDLWAGGPDRGIYRTTNGGTSWERVHYIDEVTGCVDLIMRPDDPDVLLAAMWQRIRQPEAYDYGGPGCAVYRSDDGGDTWNLVGGGLPAPSANGGRIGLSLCASQPDVMHAIYADRTGYFDGLYRSVDGGSSWTRTNDGALSGVFASYGWWFGNVRTHPVDPNTIYVLGLDFYRSINGGASYFDSGGSMHVDHHGLDFGSGPSPVIYEGNDGGVYRSSNGGGSWAKLPELPITQIYRLALDAGNPDALYAGAQDNGTNRTLDGSLDTWEWIYGGDGFQPLVHPENSSRLWAQYQYGNVAYSSNGGGSWSGATNGISSGDRKNWNAPHVQDPTNADVRYFGTQRVYRSSGNTSWTIVSPDLTGGPHQGNGGQVNGTLTTLAVSPLDGQVIWAGSDDGHVQVTTDGGTSWTVVSASLPERWVTAVRTDPFDRETAFVTISGFRWNEPLPHVFRTTDMGASWEAIAGNLPEAPTSDILIDPQVSDHYVVATDVGVYETENGGLTWSMLGSDLPNVVVTMLALDPQTRVLTAATYGRSLFSYDWQTVSVGDDLAGAPTAPGRTLPPTPNPTGSGTWIRWDSEGAGEVSLEAFSVSGRRVWSRDTESSGPGPTRAWWDGRDAGGGTVSPGVYFVRVTQGGVALGSHTVTVRR